MRTRLILLSALLISSAAFATPAEETDAPLLITQAPKPAAPATPTSDDDEDEEDAPPKPADKPADAPPAPAPAEGAVVVPGAAESQQLVSGAPLNNPNVAVHTVERKQFSDRGKRE